MRGGFVPGDVAVVPSNLGPVRPITFYENENTSEVMFTNASGYQHPARHIAKDARRVVVIDPEDREQIKRLDAAYQAALDASPRYAGLDDVMQAALRSLLAPPKPEEPQGLGAVVEDAEGRLFVKWSTEHRVERNWKCHGSSGDYRLWADVHAVKVLSEGVTP